MSSAHIPHLTGISPPTRTAAAQPLAPNGQEPARPVERLAAVQDRLASWLSDLTTLHELTERLSRADSLDTTLHELVQAGAALVGSQRGLAVLEPADGEGPSTMVGLGLEHADLGTIETVPREAATYGRVLDSAITEADTELIHPDIAADLDLSPRHREVAAQLGIAASYALPLTTEATGPLGAVVWMYDEPAEPTDRQRHIAGLYCSFAGELVAKQLQLARARSTVEAMRAELLPRRLPHVPGVRLGFRHRSGAKGGGDWYDALALPEGALGLTVGGVTGAGPGAATLMGRLRAALRAYAVTEGEDPVAVLSDLELLLHLTEPARTATAVFVHAEPAMRRLVLAGAGHCPPLLVSDRRVRFVETSLSAPLGMLNCWEVPSVELPMEPGETLVLYTDGLLHRSGGTMDQALSTLHKAAAEAPQEAREDPDLLCEHLLASCLPEGAAVAGADSPEDVVLLAVRFG